MYNQLKFQDIDGIVWRLVVGAGRSLAIDLLTPIRTMAKGMRTFSRRVVIFF
jgi:hypothetical protein